MPGTRLMDEVWDRIRVLHYSRSTEKNYCYWIRFYIRYFRYRHPKDMGAREISYFLTFLATERHVAASTQNQAFDMPCCSCIGRCWNGRWTRSRM